MYGMSGFAEKLNIQNCENWTGNCVHYMHGISGLVEKLNIPQCIYSMGNGVHYIRTECLDLQKNWISWTAKIQREIVYILYVRKLRICSKIEYPELRKFNGKFFTLYTHRTSWFVENLNIQNCENWTGNCVHYISTKCQDLQRNWISRTE